MLVFYHILELSISCLPLLYSMSSSFLSFRCFRALLRHGKQSAQHFTLVFLCEAQVA